MLGIQIVCSLLAVVNTCVIMQIVGRNRKRAQLVRAEVSGGAWLVDTDGGLPSPDPIDCYFITDRAPTVASERPPYCLA